MLLFLTRPDDAHADWAEAECRRRNVPYFRFHTAQFPTAVALTITPEADGALTGCLETQTTHILLETITGIWHRRPEPPAPHPELDPDFAPIVRKESAETLAGLYCALWDRRWVNSPTDERRANHKVYQMRLARALGWTLPQTLITNDAQEAWAFFQRCQGQMVYKPLVPFIMLNDREEYGVYTSLVTQANIDAYLDSIQLSPCFFQQLVPKQYELRVNVIGEHVWSTAIFTQEREDTRIDHRHATEDCRHEAVLLPTGVEQLCLRLNQALGLRMSNIDLIYTPQGEYIFLEVNPNGQWAWIEEQVGFPLCTALIDELLGENTLYAHPYLRDRSLHFTANTAIKQLSGATVIA